MEPRGGVEGPKVRAEGLAARVAAERSNALAKG